MRSFSRLVGALALASGLVLTALATQEAPAPRPPIEERVDAVFSRWDTTNGPGCAVSVMKDGEIVLARGYGMANLDHDVPIRTDTVFHVASVSKEFTAAAIALLAIDGALSLDDPVQKHLPWVPEFEHPVTIRNLVHHDSGMRDQWSLLNMSGWRYSWDRITNDDVRYLIEKQRDLNFTPGERYLYSNTGYTLMGLIVEAVSGQTLREFTTARIFEPLGMTRTFFRDDFSEIVKDQAYGYERDPESGGYSSSVTNFDTVGATSLLTTVEDMARWDRNFIDPVVGGAEFLELIHERGVFNDGGISTYAFGLGHGTYRGLPTVGHGGADAGYRANFMRFPEHGHSFVVLCNLAQTSPGQLARRVADIYLEDALAPPAESDPAPPVAVKLPDAEADRVVGTYWGPVRGVPLAVERGDEGIQLRIGVQARLDLIHTGDGVFEAAEGLTLRFEPATGPAERLISWPTADPETLEHLERVPSFDPETTTHDEYAGDYRSPELPVTYEIRRDGDDLVLRWLKATPWTLTPMAHDILVAPRGTLRFWRDEAGAITGFTLDSGRVRNVRFWRAE